jgi:low affinity Fe/Cu permease
MTFNRFAHVLSQWAGHPKTFQAAILLFVVWGGSGPYFHYNDTWQLIINTSTTIITFLMVFLIQNTQNRDNDTLHIKIDELLRTTQNAQNALLDLDKLTAKELRTLRKSYAALSASGGDQRLDVETLCQQLTGDEASLSERDAKSTPPHIR